MGITFLNQTKLDHMGTSLAHSFIKEVIIAIGFDDGMRGTK